MNVFDSLKMFIQPHPVLHPDAGDIFTPRGSYAIRFFFDGGFTVEGAGPELEVNFNDDDLLILATGDSVFRFKRSALIGFQLKPQSADEVSDLTSEMKGLLH